jgi:phosphatidylinositol alpha-1,6-mannosyltransferase
MNKMRIVLFVSEFPPQPGGIGTHAWSLANELHRRGAILSVVSDDRSPDGDLEREFDGAAPFAVARVPIAPCGFRQIRRIVTYLCVIRRLKPDVVLASGRFPLLVASVVSGSGKKAVILHGSEAGGQSSFLRRIVLRALSKFETIISVSKFTASHFGLNSGDARMAVIPNGVDGIKFRTAGSGSKLKGSPALLTVGNVTERKGQENVIRALPQILERYPDAVYHIVGIATLREKFEHVAAELGVAEQVVFHGAVSDDALLSALASADVFLMLSNNVTASGDVEGFGIAILEANCYGVPAIGSLGCGIEDAIDHEVTGMLVKPTDSEAVANAVSTLMRERDRFGKAARAWAAQHAWESVGERYQEVLRVRDMGP